jgi:hypothetical protein
MRLAPRIVYLAVALALTACDGGGCGGGTTCPFADVAFAAVEGKVFKSDGSPYLNQEVVVNVGPGFTFGRSPVDGSGRYRVTLDLMSDPGGETMPVVVTVGVPPIMEEAATIPFSRDRSTRPTTVIDLHER